MGSAGKGYRTLDVEGFEVLVGRTAKANDQLTLKVADPGDFWLHVGGGYAGSHVVVRNPQDLSELPRDVLDQAARLAAWHSKARGASGKVEVHVCRARDVSKPPRFPAGKVQLRRWDAVKVYVREPDVGKDLSKQ